MQGFIPWLMDAARERQGLRSDRALARHIGAHHSAPTPWRAGYVIPSDEAILKLCICADFPPQAAFLAANMLRAGGKPAAIYGEMARALGFDLERLTGLHSDTRNAA